MSKFKNLKELEGAYKELEKQLAEKDRIIESLKPIYESVVQTCHNDAKEIDRLNKLIAEKEKDLHYKTAECEKWKADYENCSKLEKMMTKEHQYCLDNWRASEQDKISFAVEKIKELKKNLRDKVCLMENDEHCYPQNAIHWQDVVAIIYKQIKELQIEKIVEFYINTEDKNKEPLLYVADEISSPFPNFKGKIKPTTLNKIMKDINANCKTKKEIE